MRRALASKPSKMWIDGRTFEIPRLDKKDGARVAVEDSHRDSKEKYDIKTNGEGKLFTSFHLPQIYHHKLATVFHVDLKRLEGSTNTVISVPAVGNLTITGDDEEKITQVRNVVHSLVGEIRDQNKPLQFISIPIGGEEIVGNFNKFKEDILNGETIQGMEESIFQSPLKLHLTVVIFTLSDDAEKLAAIQALKEYKNTILDPLIEKVGPIQIKISGIDCMEKNLKKVNVLYGKASILDEVSEFNLQQIVNDISDHFYEKGLVQRYKSDVKLHMTLINTKYRKGTDSPKKKRWAKRLTFDATSIMDRHREFYFGTCHLNSIHLSLISSIGDDGFYKPLSIIRTEA